MRYYKVKSEYDQTYKNPHVHDGNILIGGELYEDEILEELREIS